MAPPLPLRLLAHPWLCPGALGPSPGQARLAAGPPQLGQRQQQLAWDRERWAEPLQLEPSAWPAGAPEAMEAQAAPPPQESGTRSEAAQALLPLGPGPLQLEPPPWPAGAPEAMGARAAPPPQDSGTPLQPESPSWPAGAPEATEARAPPPLRASGKCKHRRQQERWRSSTCTSDRPTPETATSAE